MQNSLNVELEYNYLPVKNVSLKPLPIFCSVHICYVFVLFFIPLLLPVYNYNNVCGTTQEHDIKN